MKSILTAAAAAVVLTAGTAMAWEGRTVACYDKHYVGPTYKTHKTLVMAGHEEYKHVNGRVELVRYDPVYKETKSLASSGYWVMKQVSCGCPKC